MTTDRDATTRDETTTAAVLQALDELAPNCTFIVTDDHFSSVNKEFEELSGYSTRELAGHDSLLLVAPSERDTVRQKMYEMGADASRPAFEFHLIRRDGEVRLVRGRVISVESGERSVIFGSFLDITQYRAHEEKLRLIEWLTSEVGRAENADHALARALQGVCELTGWPMGEVWIENDDRQLVPGTYWLRRDSKLQSFASRNRRLAFSLGTGLPDLAWTYKRTIWLGDLPSFGGLRGAKAAAAAGLHAAVATPILAADRPIGVLLFFLSEAKAEDSRLVELVSAVAAHIAPIIRLKEAEDALAENEQHIRETLDAAHEAFVAIDDSGRIAEWNRPAETLFGWTRQEVLGRLLVETIVPERFRDAHRNGIEHYAHTGEGPALGKVLRLDGLRSDGEEVAIEMTITPVSYRRSVAFSAFIRAVANAAPVSLEDVIAQATAPTPHSTTPRKLKAPSASSNGEPPAVRKTRTKQPAA